MFVQKTFEGTTFNYVIPNGGHVPMFNAKGEYLNPDNVNYYLSIESDNFVSFQAPNMGALWCSKLEFEFNLPQIVRPNGRVHLGRTAEASLSVGLDRYFQTLAPRPFENISAPFTGAEEAVKALFDLVVNSLVCYEDHFNRPVQTLTWRLQTVYDETEVSVTVRLEPRLAAGFYTKPAWQLLNSTEALVLKAAYEELCGDGLVDLAMEDGSVKQVPSRQVIEDSLNIMGLDTKRPTTQILLDGFNYRYPLIPAWSDSVFQSAWNNMLQRQYEVDVEQWANSLDTNLRRLYGKTK